MPQTACPRMGCGKSWDPDVGILPMCLSATCEIRSGLKRRDKQIEPFSTTPDRATLSTQGTGIDNSIDWLRKDTALVPYKMQGAQSATTTVTLRDTTQRSFSTNDQMHSEMRALQFMLDSGEWSVVAGFVRRAHDDTRVLPAQFTTQEPHCGFCTLFLLAAGLPVGQPTKGNHKLASRHNYQLPRQLMVNPHFLGRVIGKGEYHSYSEIKCLLNAFCQHPADQWVLEYTSGLCADDRSTCNPLPQGKVAIKLADIIATGNAGIVFAVWQYVFERIALANTNTAD